MPNFVPLSNQSLKYRAQGWRKNLVIARSLTYGISLALVGSLTTLSGCTVRPNFKTEKKETTQVSQQNVPNYYKVKPGDTLSHIANRYGLNYRRLGAINGLDSEYTIYAGQWIKLWDGSSGAIPSYTAAGTATAASAMAPYPTQRTPYVVATGSKKGFQYPSVNKVINNFSASTGVNGMWFTGRLGDPVLASKGGQVLYAGGGLPEYGNLIMIRHDGKYVSAYAHNDKLLVKEGDQVRVGQRIATMGRSGQTMQVALEFQIRENGTPIDPRIVLKTR